MADATNPKSALYHQQGKPPLKLLVKSENPDGTVNLVDATGRTVVSECAVTQEPENGSCTIMAEDAPAKPAPAKDDKKDDGKKEGK